MTEHGLIFTAESIEAIKAKRKGQTRRVVKLGGNAKLGVGSLKHFDVDMSRAYPDPGIGAGGYIKAPFKHKKEEWDENPHYHTITRIYPPWCIGDRIYVKETFGFDSAFNSLSPQSIYEKSQNTGRRIDSPTNKGFPHGNCIVLEYKAHRIVDFVTKWRSPIFMPKWASRIWLEVVGVRAEKLVDISEEDAKAEGIREYLYGVEYGEKHISRGYGTERLALGCMPSTAKEGYRKLWNRINYKKGFGWGDSSWHGWCFVIEFKEVEKT